MSSNYETTLKVPVKVVGVPENVRVLTAADEYLTVSLEGKGTALLKSGRAKNKHSVSVNNSRFNMNQGHASLSTLILRDSVASMLPPSVAIRSIQPDSLTYTYALQHVMKVPVVYDGTIASADQFFMERIEFSPDSVQAMVLVSDTTVIAAYAGVDNLVLNADTLALDASIKPVQNLLINAAGDIVYLYDDTDEKFKQVGFQYMAGVNYQLLSDVSLGASFGQFIGTSDYKDAMNKTQLKITAVIAF